MKGHPLNTIQYPDTFDELIDKVYEWFDDKGLDDPIMQYAKVNEEIGEIGHELTRNNFDGKAMVDALGDSFVTLIGMCHHLGIDPIECLSEAYMEIKDRKGKVIDGSFVKEEK